MFSDRLLASTFTGLIAYMAALDAGIPAWRHLPIGDASDFGVCAGFAVWFGIRALALAAATGTAKTAKRVECEASQSGPRRGATPNRDHD